MAPGEVRAAIALTLKSRGVTVTEPALVPAGECPACGGAIAAPGPLVETVRCPACGGSWDTDDQAARSALAVLREAVRGRSGLVAAPPAGAGRFTRLKAAAMAAADGADRDESNAIPMKER